MAPKKEDPKKDVPQKAGLIVAVLAGLLVAALAVAFVTTAKRASGPATSDMAMAEPAGGTDVKMLETPVSSDEAPAMPETESASVASPTQSGVDSSVSAIAPAPQEGALPGAPDPSAPNNLEPVPIPGGEGGGMSPGAGVSSPGSEGMGVPMPAPEKVPSDMATPACEFPQFVGLLADDPRVDEVLKTRAHRLLPPGASMTQDHSPARINLDLDEKGIIRKVWCG